MVAPGGRGGAASSGLWARVQAGMGLFSGSITVGERCRGSPGCHEHIWGPVGHWGLSQPRHPSTCLGGDGQPWAAVSSAEMPQTALVSTGQALEVLRSREQNWANTGQC